MSMRAALVAAERIAKRREAEAAALAKERAEAEAAVRAAAEALAKAARKRLSRTFVVVYDFFAEDPKTELTVRKGEIVESTPELEARGADGWMLVTVADDADRSGFVPRAYASPVSLKPCSPGRMISMTSSPTSPRSSPRPRKARPPWGGARSPRSPPPWESPERPRPASPERRRKPVSGMHFGSPTSRRSRTPTSGVRVDDWAAGSYSSSDAASPSDAASAPPSAGSAPPSAGSAPPSAGYASSFFDRSDSRRGGSESRRSGSESDARRSHPDRNDGSPVGRMFRDEIVDLEGDLAALAGKLTSLGERLGCVSRVVAAEAP